MMSRGEFWGVVGVIAIQAVCVWLVLRMAGELVRIYLLQYP